MVILDYIGNQTIHCSFKNDVHVTYSRNLRWSEPITFQYYSLAPTWSYCIVCHYGSTQNSAVNHLAPTQCPYLARLVLQILEPSCTQLLSNGCNLTTMMSLPGPLSGAIFSANPGWNVVNQFLILKCLQCTSKWPGHLNPYSKVRNRKGGQLWPEFSEE